MYVGKELEVH